MGHLLGAIESPGAIALVGAIAGILGAVLGAIAGGGSTYLIQQRGHEVQRKRDRRAELRERDRELAVVRGVARVWRTRFDDLRHLMNEYALDPKNPRWWPPEVDPETSLPLEDM